jgi:hypothetical protein
MVGDRYPILPITVSWKDHSRGVRYFYSKPCGHLMSVEVSFSPYGNTYIVITEHKGKFQLPPVSEIVVKYEDKYVPKTTKITKYNCRNHYTNCSEGKIQIFNARSPSDDIEIININ